MFKRLLIILVYLLLDRSTPLYSHFDDEYNIYTTSSKVVTVIVLLCYFCARRTRFDKGTMPVKTAFYFALPYVSLFVSTAMMGGDIQRYFMMTYPIIGMYAFISLFCYDRKSTMTFVSSLGDLYIVLASINLLFILWNPYYFGFDHGGIVYFLGFKNQMGYPLLMGFLFLLFEYYYLKNVIKILFYGIIYMVSIVMAFSGSNIIGMAVLFFILLIPLVGKILRKISVAKILLGGFVLFILLIVMGNLAVILKIPAVEYVIEQILKKNATLTNRTFIWIQVIAGFLNSPVIGHGIRDTMNLFWLHERFSQGYFSAHNQFLQTLYEGGLMFYVAIVPFIYRLSKRVQQIKLTKLSLFIKAFLITYFVMYMSEAVGIDKMFEVMLMCYMMAMFPHYSEKKVEVKKEETIPTYVKRPSVANR